MTVDDLNEYEANEIFNFLARRIGSSKISIEKISIENGLERYIIAIWWKNLIYSLLHHRDSMFYVDSRSWKECLREILRSRDDIVVNKFKIFSEHPKVEYDVVFWSPEENLEKLLIEKDLMKE